MLQKINLNENHIKIAFSSNERPYIKCLANRCNHLLNLIIKKENTKEEKLEYHSLKYAIKELGGIEKENLEKVSR